MSPCLVKVMLLVSSRLFALSSYSRWIYTVLFFSFLARPILPNHDLPGSNLCCDVIRLCNRLGLTGLVDKSIRELSSKCPVLSMSQANPRCHLHMKLSKATMLSSQFLVGTCRITKHIFKSYLL